ncbi:MAG: VOC family protein [Planctomycetota bacterium]|nr:MAG: VOC family protein [Planctomycetota bacterium]
MLAFGDVHIYASDFSASLRFWSEGIGLTIVEQELGRAASFAVLEFPDGPSALRLFGGVAARAEEAPDLVPGDRPDIHFDIMTDEFEDTLVRALECGGRQIGEVETYNGRRAVTLADPDGNSFELLETD